MTTCPECGSKRLRTNTLRAYRDPALGLPDVVLENAVIETTCTDCGEGPSITIPNLEGLLAAMAKARILDPSRLDAAAVRFLRTHLDLSGRALAETLGVRAETVSRWEHGESMAPTADKLLRTFVLQHLMEDACVEVGPKHAKALMEMRIQVVNAVAPRERRFYLRPRAPAAWLPRAA